MNWRIPLADLDFGAEEAAAAARVIESKWLTMGAVTQQFEALFAEFTGAKHAVAVTNGTAGLHLACLAAGIQPGDEVIVPSLTFVATAAAILYTGGTPIFVDICGETDLTLSPEAVEAAITPKTRAVMLMHYGGYACDMPRIREVARRHNLVVIEDAAHAAGSFFEGHHLGTAGLVGSFSFFSNKNLATGEGGMLVTNDDDTAAKLRLLRSHGMTSLTWDRHQGHAWSYDVVDLGYNYRIDEIRSALGIEQLKKLPAANARRQELTALYRSRLKRNAPGIVIPFESQRGTSASHILPIILPKGVNRSRFMESMKAEGIQTSIHYPPIHLFDFYRQKTGGNFALPITEDIAAREVTLPLYPGMSAADVDLVTDTACSALADQGVVNG